MFWWVLVLVIDQRAFEIWLTARHTRWMQSHGGREFGREHYPWMILMHAAFLVALPVEYLAGRQPRLYLGCAVPLVLAQVLRYSAMAALGKFWNTRVWVLPGTVPVQRGIFRWMRHPNYTGVVLEIFFLPAMFGLWVTAVGFSILNALMLRVRIRVEEQALRGGGGGRD